MKVKKDISTELAMMVLGGTSGNGVEPPKARSAEKPKPRG